MNWIVLLLLLLVVPARAHPVAQGSLNVLVHEDRITVEARVSTEEAFVEQGFSKGAAASSKEEIWARHGAYILQHLRLEADGKPLDGRVVRVTPPANAAPSSLITYDLEFATASPTAALVLRQDVLNEFEFAPGNPWEATFVVTLGQAGRTTRSGLLFTQKAGNNHII